MSRTAWQPLNWVNVQKIELGSFIVVARPDGKSWSGILRASEPAGILLANSNNRTDIHFLLNPTASFTILQPPKWELGFGHPRLGL